MPDQHPSPYSAASSALDDLSLAASKPRRKVRMVPHEPSTPDEGELSQTLADDRE